MSYTSDQFERSAIDGRAIEPKATAPKLTERLADQAHRKLEEMIVTLQLPPESMWSEVTLSERLDIGRTPVREAVQRLASEHLVVILRRHGIMISPVNVERELLVLEAREPMERLLAEKAARRATAEQKAHLAQLAEAMEERGKKHDIIAFLRLYFDSKKVIGAASRNPYMAQAIAPLHTLSRRFYFIHHRQLNDLPVVARLHAEAARAIARGNGATAVKGAERQLKYAFQFTKRILEGNL